MSAADDRAPLALLARCLLVGQAITAALRSRGFSLILLEWPAHSDRLPGMRMRAVASGARAAVVVCDLDTPDHVHDVALLVRPGALPWLVLTETPASAVWGRLLEEGASGVVPATTTIDGLIQAVRDVRAGRSPTPPELRERVIQEWHLVAEQQRDLTLRMARLTPREFHVLAMLNDGMSVRQIAESSGVSEFTVRSQVKALRKKLAVDSQLAAVAAYRRALELLRVGRIDR